MLISAAELRQIKAGRTQYQRELHSLMERVNLALQCAAQDQKSKAELPFTAMSCIAGQLRTDLIKRLAQVGISASVRIKDADERHQHLLFDLSW
jgi:hypothetical protein